MISVHALGSRMSSTRKIDNVERAKWLRPMRNSRGKLEELERRLDSHDEAIVNLFAMLKRLLEPPEPKKREMGFHVRERSARYRTKRRL